eukprot:gene12355-14489_t
MTLLSNTESAVEGAKVDPYKGFSIPSPKRGRRPDKQKSPNYPQYSHIPRLATAGVQRITSMGFDFYLVDVREAAQFAEESIQGSVNHPLATLETSCEPMDRNTMVLVFGTKEKGYPMACEASLKLTAKGFKQVIVVESTVKDMADVGFFYNSTKDTTL